LLNNTTATTSANITPLAITVAATGVNKVYDANATDAATLASSGVLAGDTVNFTDTAASFADKNVGTGKTVSVSGISAAGTDAGNYSYNTTAATSANITPMVLNLTGTRVYDANTDAGAGLFGSSGVLTGVAGETLTLGGTGTLSSKNVNPAQTFSSLAGFTLAGNGSALASNYTLTGGTDSVNITKLSVTVAATGANKVYDANANDAATLASSGVLTGDTVSFTDSAATFADKNVGNGKTVSVSGISAGGSDAGNYSYNTTAATSANITPLAITVAATGANKVYDANTADAATLASSGVFAGDAVNFTDTSATFADKNVGNGKTVSVSGIGAAGSDAGNYLLNNTTATTSANITPLAITVAATGANKVYDANTADAATLASSGVLAGDTVNFTDSAATFADKNVGTGKTVSVSGISAAGTDAGNYSYNTTASTSANITPATLTVTGTVATNRAYDGTVTDTLKGAALAGVLGSDTVMLGNDTTGTFYDKNVGTGKAVTATMTIGGTDAGDYRLTQPGGLTANITPKVIAVAAIGSNKVYDGNTSDKVVLGSNGMVSGDALTFTSAAANFAGAGVGNDKTVTVTGIRAAGSDAGNYTLADNSTTTTADIISGAGIQDTAVAVGYLELSPDAIATPYGVAPSDSPGQLTGNVKLLHRPVEPNRRREDFKSGLSLLIVDGGVRMPANAP